MWTMKIWRSVEKYRRKSELQFYRENYAAEWIQHWKIVRFPRQAKRKGSSLTFSQMERHIRAVLMPIFCPVATYCFFTSWIAKTMIMSFCLNICKRSTWILKTLCVDFVIDSSLEFHNYSNEFQLEFIRSTYHNPAFVKSDDYESLEKN